jgi:hypothetical protein
MRTKNGISPVRSMLRIGAASLALYATPPSHAQVVINPASFSVPKAPQEQATEDTVSQERKGFYMGLISTGLCIAILSGFGIAVLRNEKPPSGLEDVDYR